MSRPEFRAFRLVSRGQGGLACDGSGVALGAAELVRNSADEHGRRHAETISPNALGDVLDAAYGPRHEVSVERVHRGLIRAAAALENGDLCLAGIEAVLLGLPDLTATALERVEKLAIFAEGKKKSSAAPAAQKAAPDTPKHPGWPAGASDSQGGKFRPKTPEEVAADRPARSSSAPGRGMTEALAEAIKTAVRLFLARAEAAPDIRIRLAALLAEVGLEAYPYVRAYFDPPKTLEALQAAAQLPSEVGYDDHHIVEQATANPDGSEDDQIDSPDNLARIPTVKHWELNRWYQRSNRDLEGMTPREYLEGKSWADRLRVGLMGLRDIGVLK